MLNLDFLCWSSLMGTTLHAVPSKSCAYSTNYHACIAIPTWHRCAPPILFWPWPPYNLLPWSCLTWIFFVDPHCMMGTTCVQCPAKAVPFQQIIMHSLHYQHDVDVHLLFVLTLTCIQPVPEVVFNLDFLLRFSLMGTTLRAALSKSYAFSTNYYACIAMPAWHRCAPPVLFWPPYDLLLRSCLTWIMYILQCPHDIHVHLFCFWPPYI